MTRVLSCAQGHRWEVGALVAGAGLPACPVCGGRATTAGGDQPIGGDRPTGPRSPEDTPTVLHADAPPPYVAGQAYATERAAATDADQPPQIPDFEIVAEVGRGGMGIVYKARQISRNRQVALKVIRRDRLQHEDAVRRFRREAQAAARLAHPNIVLVHDSDHTGDTHYLVMEYVPGTTLERLVQREGALPVGQACDYMRQAALGLQHAHEQALVHRDVKPSNLMVSWPGGQPDKSPPPGAGIVKILDMGVARLYQLAGAPGDSLSTLTQGGAVIGTADYVAPEQLEDPHRADIRADLYSLGCTFYFLLTGQVPFPGGTLLQKLDKQRWETPPAVNQIRDDVPASVVAVVRKLMAKSPKERYQTPLVLAGDLKELAKKNFAARPAPPARQPVRRLADHGVAVATVALAADGLKALSGGKDGTLRLWDVSSGREMRALPRQAHEIRAALFLPGSEASTGSETIAVASGIGIRAWHIESGRELTRFTGHTDAVRCLAPTPDGKLLVSGGDDKTARVWDVAAGREMCRFSRHGAGVTALSVNPHGTHVLSAGRDHSLRLWEILSGKEVAAFAVPRGMVLSAALSADGQSALSGHFDTFVRLWDAHTGRELRRFQGHKQMVTAALFTRDGRVLSASQDQTIRLWDVDSGCEVACFTGHTSGVTCLAVSLAESIVLSGGADHAIHVWQLPP